MFETKQTKELCRDLYEKNTKKGLKMRSHEALAICL
jgi:hypothetical protein